MSEKYAFTSRLVSLESACFLARRGMNQMSKLTMEGPGSKSSFGAAAFQSVEKSINWDTVLRGINQRYDRKENAFAQPSYRQRKDAVDAIVSQLKREKQGVEQMLVDVSRRSRRPETPIEILLAQIIGFPLEAILPTQERVKARSDQVPVAFALSAYRHKHQEYPAALTDLTPDFIPELPNDVYTGDPLKYRKVGGGYELFAVGENLKEDSGLLTSTSDDIGVNTSDLKVVERVRLPSFGPILGYIGWGVGGIAFVVIGVVGVKLLTGKKKRPRRNSSRKGRSRNTARGLPPRRRQR